MSVRLANSLLRSLSSSSLLPAPSPLLRPTPSQPLSSSSSCLLSPFSSSLHTTTTRSSPLLRPSSSLLSSSFLAPPSPLPLPSPNGGRFLSGGGGGGEGGVTQTGGVTFMTPSISILRGKDGQEVFLVGTHLSEESAIMVEEVITTVKPDNIFLELCPKRAQQLADGSQLRQYDAFKSASWVEDMLKKMGHQVPEFYFQLMQAYSQAIGLVPGAEFKKAMNLAEEMRESTNQVKPEVIFGDIDGDVTMKKIGDAVTLTSLLQMMNSAKSMDYSIVKTDITHELARKLQDPHTSAEEKIELLKNREYVREFSRVAGVVFPAAANALLKERDAYMCDGLLDLKNQTTVAIVGMAHMDGIEEEWKKRSGLA